MEGDGPEFSSRTGHDARCVEPKTAASTRSRRKTVSRVNYKKLAGEEPEDESSSPLPSSSSSSSSSTPLHFGSCTPNKHIFKIINATYPSDLIRQISDGSLLTLSFFCQEDGFGTPLLIHSPPSSIGMTTPSSPLTIQSIGDIIGHAHPINVMDCSTQEELVGWTMSDLVDYYRVPVPDRKKILNQISLEFSQTPLRLHVTSPSFVRALDWIENAWPKAHRGTVYFPHVRYYCLTSTGGCFTDFHVDFGGTSVWYHMHRGRKIFLLIRPTEYNMKRYEEWLCQSDQSRVFFPNTIGQDQCQMAVLEEGKTLVIPCGWIHAVYTPVDSIAFGGNFLHSLDVRGQLNVHCIETRTCVPKKFRFPFFIQIMFYGASYMLQTAKNNKRLLCLKEKEGLAFLIEALTQWDVTPGGDADGKGSISEAAKEAAEMAGCLTVTIMIQELRNIIIQKKTKLKLSLKIHKASASHDAVATSVPPTHRPTIKLKLTLPTAPKNDLQPPPAVSSLQIFVPQNPVYDCHGRGQRKKKPKIDGYDYEFTKTDDDEWRPSRPCTKNNKAKKSHHTDETFLNPDQQGGVSNLPIVKSSTAKKAPKGKKASVKADKKSSSARDRLKKRLGF